MIVIFNNVKLVIDDGELQLPSLTAGFETTYSTDVEFPATTDVLKAFDVDLHHGNGWVQGTAILSGTISQARARWTEWKNNTVTVTFEVSLVPEWATKPICDVINSDDVMTLFTPLKTLPVRGVSFNGGALTDIDAQQMSGAMTAADFVERFAAHTGLTVDASSVRSVAPQLVVVPMRLLKSRHMQGTSRFFAGNVYTGVLHSMRDEGVTLIPTGQRSFTAMCDVDVVFDFATHIESGYAGRFDIEITRNGMSIYSRTIYDADWSEIATIHFTKGDSIVFEFSALTAGDTSGLYGKCDTTEAIDVDTWEKSQGVQVLGFNADSAGYYGGTNCNYGFFGCFDASFLDIARAISYYTGLSFTLTDTSINFETSTQTSALDAELVGVENNFDQLAARNIVTFDNYAEVDGVPTAGFAEVLTTEVATEEWQKLDESVATLAEDAVGVAKVSMFEAVGVGFRNNNEHMFFLAKNTAASLAPIAFVPRVCQGVLYNYTMTSCEAVYFSRINGKGFAIVDKRYYADNDTYNIKGALL